MKIGQSNAEKRKHAERIRICHGLVSNVLEELKEGDHDSGLEALQEAVALQQDVNKLVFELNQAYYKDFNQKCDTRGEFT